MSAKEASGGSQIAISTGPLRPKQSDILIQLAVEEAALFSTDDGVAYADVWVDGHRETYPVKSSVFRQWMMRRFFEVTSGAPNSEAMTTAVSLIEATARFGAPRKSVFVRVGAHGGKIYLDLANHAWEVVEIDANGWRIVADPPIRFRRAPGMRTLPKPESGGRIDLLRPFVNVEKDSDFVLVVAWLLAALRPTGPYPVVVVTGEQGAAKSTFTALLRRVVDPNRAPIRALPRDEHELFIAARNGHILAFDNVSTLSSWLSDAICRLATGAGFAARRLFTNDEETLFDAARPIMCNGIEEFVTRADLADRSILLVLEPIPDEKRKPEEDIWSTFDAKHPLILGGLLDAAVHGLRYLPTIRLERLPRMADFARWVMACEPAFISPGAFWSAYRRNRNDAVEASIEGDQIAAAVCTLMANQGKWVGTASDLLKALSKTFGEYPMGPRTWPDTARALAGRLRRAATVLRKVGIEFAFERQGKDRTRIITIARDFRQAESTER